MFNARIVGLCALLGLGLTPALYAQDALRDPTRPLNYSVGKQHSISLELNSILIGGDRRLAVINGQQLRENELVANSGGVRVKSIQARQVVLEQDGKRWKLTLAGDSIRRSRSTEN